MRVFYIDEEESKNNYYIKVENVNLPEGLRGYKLFKVLTTEELIEQMKEFYGFGLKSNARIELWSGQRHISERLDILSRIPKEKEFISAYIVANNK
jgi:hypothetical protein